MNILWLLFLLQAVYAGKITPEENSKLKQRCNAKGTVQRNKYKRLPVAQSNYPFAVALSKITGTRYDYILREHAVKSFTSPFCSGVLISPRHILTAAHCLTVDQTNACKQGSPIQEKTAQEVGVFLQSCNYFRCWRGQRVRRVASVHVPQEYKSVNEACRNSTSYDIAVIELQQNADYKPICMPQKNDAVPQKVKSIGYGNYGGDDSIQAVTFVKTSEEPENNAIVAYTEYKNEAIIGGDSGGPLVHEQGGKHYLFGISSSSNDLTPEMRIGVDYIEVGPATVSSRFVDVRKHLGWICDITGVCEDGDGDFEEQEPPSFAGLE